MGLNISKLRKNIFTYISSNQILKDSCIKLANILIQKKKSNLVFLNYSNNLNKFLFWAQQLIAESLGKKKKGLLPIISSMPKDNHSVMQLYLDGFQNNFFTFFFVYKRTDESAAAVTPGTLAAEAKSLGLAVSSAWHDSLDNPPISL